MSYSKLPLLLLLLLVTACNSISEKSGNSENWWKEGIVYQLYPQSFKDSDGDGFGDFKGIIEEIDYLDELGIDIIWMNPFFESPLVDNGYDVSDYRSILERYGSLEDFKQMIDLLHSRGIKFVLDIVVNHSSNQHEWFKQSRSSRDNPYRDYYHWWPAERGEPPYRYSIFDPEGAWKYDELTDAYYLHYFAAEQPDLNWENPKLREEVYDIMNYWIEIGVDGFRLDAFQFASKDTSFPEFPEGHEKDFIKWYGMRPQLHDYLKEMNKEVLSKHDVFAVAEGAGKTMKDAHDLVDEDQKELQMVYHFETVDMAKQPNSFSLKQFKEIFSKWDEAFSEKGWIAVFLSNHDNARMVSRFGNPNLEFRTPSTQLLNTFLLSMRGTPYIYFGDELGMTNIDMPTIDQYVDIQAIGDFKKAEARGEDMNAFMEYLNYSSRENSRTPMQWDETLNAGFSKGTPWKKVNPNYPSINVSQQQHDPNSVLNHFKKMTQIRKTNKALIYGDYSIIQEEHPTVYAFKRFDKKSSHTILLNFSETNSEITLDEAFEGKTPLINNYQQLQIEGNTIILLPYQAVVF